MEWSCGYTHSYAAAVNAGGMEDSNMGYLAIQKYYSRITINNFCLSRRSDTIYGDDYSPCECVE